jgi:hypothetical protein
MAAMGLRWCVIEAAASITSRVAWANKSLRDIVKPSDYFIAMVREVIASQLIWNCLTAKHDKFANEREVRFIVMNVIARFDDLRKQFNGKTYIEARRNVAVIFARRTCPKETAALPERGVTVHSGDMGYTLGLLRGEQKCSGRSVTRWMNG